MKNKIICICIFLILVAFIFSFGFSKKEEVVKAEMVSANSNIEKEEKTNEKQDNNSLIKVDIKGAVKNPGVYEINSDKRVIDAIKLAGGTSKNANTNYVNLSTKLKDEMVIWIYTSEEISKLELDKSSTKYMIKECNCPTVDNTTCLNYKENSKSNNESIDKNNIININTASIEELIKIPGIGEGKAKQIIEYRNTNGNFNFVEDIKNVSGIGDSIYNKIKEYIKV